MRLFFLRAAQKANPSGGGKRWIEKLEKGEDMPSSPLGLLNTGSIGGAAAVLCVLCGSLIGGGGSALMQLLGAEDALAGLSFTAAQFIPSAQLRHLKQAVRNLSQALEEFEQALGSGDQQLYEEEEWEEGSNDGASTSRGDELLSMREVCQELGMSKSWVYRRIRSKELVSIKLGHNIKVRRQDLQEYLRKAPRYQAPKES
jgi:excisionase family DNA binding protein